MVFSDGKFATATGNLEPCKHRQEALAPFQAQKLIESELLKGH